MKRKAKLKGASVKAHVKYGLGTADAIEAWFYENAKTIEVYIRLENGDVAACRIRRGQLASYIKRSGE